MKDRKGYESDQFYKEIYQRFYYAPKLNPGVVITANNLTFEDY